MNELKNLEEAITLHQNGLLQEAYKAYQSILLINPNQSDAIHLMGVIAYQVKNYTKSKELIQLAIKINPHNHEFYLNLANTYRFLTDFEAALQALSHCINLKKDYAEAYYNRGSILQVLNRHEEALSDFKMAIFYRPNYPEALSHQGISLKSLYKLDESIHCYNLAIQISPDYAFAYVNRANALKELNHLNEAMLDYQKAYSINNDYHDAKFYHSLILLLLGDFDKGLELYEKRWLAESTGLKARNFNFPLWTGRESLYGKHILLHCEQGLGDVIQFCRYIPILKEQGAEITLEAPGKMSALLLNLKGLDNLIERADNLITADFHCPLMSLPLTCATKVNSIPSETPYISANPDLINKWKKIIGNHGFKIGIAWQGNKIGSVDFGRSFPLHFLEEISHIDTIRIISLQKGDGVEQLKNLPRGMHVEIISQPFDEGNFAFEDSAAIVSCLDLVITADTSLGHLTGALNVPTWLALKLVPDWRWFTGRSNSPWYPNHRLFRQRTFGDWEPVFKEMSFQLKKSLS